MRPTGVLLARALALLWAGFWLFFIVAESLAWHTPLALMVPWVLAGLFFGLAALLPWRWEAAGGRLLIGIGLVASLAYAAWSPSGLPAWSRALTLFVFGAPPIVAGVLFLVHDRAARSSQPA
jgi:hypothetical protein